MLLECSKQRQASRVKQAAERSCLHCCLAVLSPLLLSSSKSSYYWPAAALVGAKSHLKGVAAFHSNSNIDYM